MQTIKMLIREPELDFLKEKSEALDILILSLTAVDSEFYEVEIMLQNIYVIFIAGNCMGIEQTWKEAGVIINEISSKFHDLANKAIGLVDDINELNKLNAKL